MGPLVQRTRSASSTLHRSTAANAWSVEVASTCATTSATTCAAVPPKRAVRHHIPRTWSLVGWTAAALLATAAVLYIPYNRASIRTLRSLSTTQGARTVRHRVEPPDDTPVESMWSEPVSVDPVETVDAAEKATVALSSLPGHTEARGNQAPDDARDATADERDAHVPEAMPVARDDPSPHTMDKARAPVDPTRDEARPVEGQTVASDTLPMGTSDQTPEVAGALASPVENDPATVHPAPPVQDDDPHRLDMTYMPLLPWERDSLPPTRSCRPPDGMPHYCCVGSSSSAGNIYFAGGECSKNADVYPRAEAYALSYPLAPPHPARSHVACDWCRILDILWDHDWSLTFLGDSVTGQTFFGAECEMRRRGYNVTTLPIDYRQVDPHHWQFYQYGLNQVHELHVSQPGNSENVAVVRYYLVYRPSRDLVELNEVLQKSDANVLVFDHGLHYRLVPDLLSEFQDTMQRMLTKLTETPSRWKLLAWRETSAQHFDAVDGHYDKDGDMQTCVATNHNVTASRQDETTVDLVRTNIMRNVVQSLSSSVVTTLPFWSYTQPLHELHAGNGDCTHFCTFPSLWRPLWRELRNAMDDAVVRDETLAS